MEAALLKKLQKLSDRYGYAKAAAMIGERDTQALKRWLKEKNIPIYKINVVKDYLRRAK